MLFSSDCGPHGDTDDSSSFLQQTRAEENVLGTAGVEEPGPIPATSPTSVLRMLPGLPLRAGGGQRQRHRRQPVGQSAAPLAALGRLGWQVISQPQPSAATSIKDRLCVAYLLPFSHLPSPCGLLAPSKTTQFPALFFLNRFFFPSRFRFFGIFLSSEFLPIPPTFLAFLLKYNIATSIKG